MTFIPDETLLPSEHHKGRVIRAKKSLASGFH
jgi:hypothetical protein